MAERIGSKWLAAGDFMPGEVEVWSCLSNRTQDRWRAVGGKLFLTTNRLVFLPHVFDSLLGGRVWSTELGQVDKVCTEAPDCGPFSGGLRERLCVLLKDGTKELFVVGKPQEVAQKLQNSGLP